MKMGARCVWLAKLVRHGKGLLRRHGSQEVAARRDPHAETGLSGELLRYQDGITVRNGDEGIQLCQVNNRRNELVANPLNAVYAHLVAGGLGGRFHWFVGPADPQALRISIRRGEDSLKGNGGFPFRLNHLHYNKIHERQIE
jgi:hypothetical protein